MLLSSQLSTVYASRQLQQGLCRKFRVLDRWWMHHDSRPRYSPNAAAQINLLGTGTFALCKPAKQLTQQLDEGRVGVGVGLHAPPGVVGLQAAQSAQSTLPLMRIGLSCDQGCVGAHIGPHTRLPRHQHPVRAGDL